MISNTHEPGYRAVLVHKETKDRLRLIRAGMDNRDVAQERRLVTAALEIVMDYAQNEPSVMQEWLQRVRDVMRRDLEIEEASI